MRNASSESVTKCSGVNGSTSAVSRPQMASAADVDICWSWRWHAGGKRPICCDHDPDF
jgi:hypothetical protein